MKPQTPFVACVLFAIATVGTMVTGKNCNYKSSCSCVFDDGSGMVDLSALKPTPGTPMFKDQPSQRDYYLFSYNPCVPFNEGTCTNVAVCQYDPRYNVYYEIGSQSNVAFSMTGDDVVVTYISDDGVRKTVVTLQCNTDPAASPSITVTGETSTAVYEMTVNAHQACAVPSTGSSGSASLSGGSVMLIIFFSLLLTYMLAGVAFNVVRKQSGMDLIPNRNFWIDVPSLIKDGWSLTMLVVCRRQYGYVSAK